MSTDFFIACFRDNVGSNVGWHSKDGRGYTTDIDKAHVYSLEEAQRAWDRAREFDQPVSASHVKTLSVFKVDCQYVPHVTEIDASNQYVAFVRSKWDGNDLFFLTRTLPSTDFSKAKTFSRGEIEGDDQLIFIPQSLAEKAKRRTFDYSKLNNRKMVQAMGLRIPDHIKQILTVKNGVFEAL